MTRKIILGQPFSGALYAYFSDQIGGRGSHTHSVEASYYYRTLFGDYKTYVDLALTFLLLYDQVHLVPADCHVPRARDESMPRGIVPELGLRIEMEGFPSVSFAERYRHVEGFDEDRKIQEILISMHLSRPDWLWYLSTVDYEAGLSVQNSCAIICSDNRRRLIQRMVELKQGPALRSTSLSAPQIYTARSYLDVTGLVLAPAKLDHLLEMKSEGALQSYANGLFSIIERARAQPGEGYNEQMRALMLNAMESHRLANQVKGYFKGASRFFKTVGTLSGHHAPLFAAGHIADAGAFAAGKVADHFKWYEFSAEVRSALNKKELAEKLDTELNSPALPKHSMDD